MSTMRRYVMAAGAVAALAMVVVGGTQLLAPTGASANQCANACYAAHSQCRIASKGSPSCDAQLSRCLSGCGRK